MMMNWKQEVLRKKVQSTSFEYPCEDKHNCSPFTITFPPGTYQIECYGAGVQSKYYDHPVLSYGAYTRGTISVHNTCHSPIV